MLPIEVEALIQEYLEEIHRFLDLPSERSIRKLVKKSNDYVLRCLGFVLDLPAHDLFRIKYQIELDTDFVFYFRLTPVQRIRLIHMIERGIVFNKPTGFLVWVFIMRTPRLLDVPRFRKMFVGSLLCTLLSRIRSVHILF